jgi:hypothetical protein
MLEILGSVSCGDIHCRLTPIIKETGKSKDAFLTNFAHGSSENRQRPPLFSIHNAVTDGDCRGQFTLEKDAPTHNKKGRINSPQNFLQINLVILQHPITLQIHQ